MTLKRRLFIHIGTNKTGTSAIQHFLNKNREELSKKQLLYPITGCTGDAHYEISSILGFNYVKLPSPEAELKLFIERFKNEFEDSRCETGVISSEYFVLPKSVALVRSIFADFDCRIVVYFRRHDHWWLSAYNQAVKTVVKPPWGKGFQSYLIFQRNAEQQAGNYRTLLERWEKAFGQEKIIVRPYEREQNQPTIIADFLTSIGFGELYSIYSDCDVPLVNQSIDARSVFLLDLFQRMNVDQNVRQSLVSYVLKNANSKGNDPFIPPALRRRLVDESRELYKHIAQTYLSRPDGDLFFEPLPNPDAAWTKPDYPDIVEVANIVAHVLTNSNGNGKAHHIY